jgi:hypothetical protein
MVKSQHLHDKLEIFGEVGVVTSKDKIQAKLINRGTTRKFVGYTGHHSKDVYRMSNLTTNSLIISRDIICLNKTYGERKKNKTTIYTAKDDTIVLPTGIDKEKLTTNATNDTGDEGNESDKKVFRAMKKLES